MTKTIASTQSLSAFVNQEVLPYLHQLDVLPDGRPNPSASPEQRVIGRIMTAVERARDDCDTRTPDQVLESIATHGRAIEQALDQLRKSLAQREGAV